MAGSDTEGELTPATAYSYLRLSSKRQANTSEKQRYRDGFRRQIAMRDKYLRENPHLTLDTRFVLHDIGVSARHGANSAKGGKGKLAMFLAEVEAGRIATGSYLLVESLDRMTRQQVSKAQATLLQLVNSGIVVVSLVDNQTYREKAPATQFVMSIMSLSRAHEESEVKAERLRATWEQKRRKAATTKLSGRCPAWLRLVDGEFVERDGRFQLVREIMGLLAAQQGRDRIAKILNARGEKPWGHGRSWHGGTIQKITDNRALIGEFQPHRLVYEEGKGEMIPKRVPDGPVIPDYFPRVIDEELWDAARRVANKRRLGKAPNAGGPLGTVVSNLFGTVAGCGVCLKPMNYRDRGPRSTPVLRCSEERAGLCTNAYRIPYHDTENAILSWLVRLDISGGAPGEAARLEREMKAAIAKRDELQSQGENIVREIGAGSRFARAPLAQIEADLKKVEMLISETGARISALKASGGADDRRMAVGHLQELRARGAPDDEIFAVRSRIRSIIRTTFEGMWCYPSGHVEIITIDKTYHAFRDGYWWDEQSLDWVPWAGAFFGGGYRASRKELERRRIWLEEAAAARAATLGDEPSET